MAPISTIITVTITKSSRVVTQQAFGVPVIFGPSNRIGSDPYRVYTDPADMLADGFLIADPEYKHAVLLCSQPIRPQKFVVSKNTAAVAQVDTFAVNTITASHVYTLTINSVIINYTAGGSETQQSILAALLTAIGVAFPSNPPVTGAVTGSGAGALLTLTSTVAGVGVSYTAIDALLTHVAVTPNHSISQDIATCQGVIAQANQFYGVLVCSKVKTDILQVAAYIESQLLVYVSATADSDTLTSVATDVMSLLKGFSYNRTMVMYSAMATSGPDAAWMGYMLPTTPGIGNWALKTLNGVIADNLSATQIGNVVSKNGNIYVPMGGAGITLYGTCASGEYFDVTIFSDWLASTIQTNVFTVLTDPNNLKVPYTNQGIALIENQIAAALRQGQDNQGIVAGWTVFGPDVNDVPTADKKSRTLNGVGFTAELAGAINKVNIRGFLTV